ncbi:hypothetical protein [Enterococcus timonensis]|uniref:hypothetical protein n=1 Tax=Enterococcus timonensis TaxID=1852364 RepID=UPI0008DA23CD|nr:hypothetical protein [Enterococcus timonensis]
MAKNLKNKIGWRMFLGILTLLVAVFIAMGVKNQQNQFSGQLEDLKQIVERLDTLMLEIEAGFSDDANIFLSQNLTQEQLTTFTRERTAISSVTSDVPHLNPQIAAYQKEIIEKKAQIDELLQVLQAKFQWQRRLNESFSQPIITENQVNDRLLTQPQRSITYYQVLENDLTEQFVTDNWQQLMKTTLADILASFSVEGK